MRIVVIGATGLVGSLLVDRLLALGVQVYAIGRRAGEANRPGRRDHVAPPADWPRIAREIGADAAVSALGTTWRAAGSEAAFRAVDLDMVVGFARAAREGGAERMLTISSVGADAGSRSFYLAVKGEMERDLAALGFSRLDILQPGLLVGSRGVERRLGERIGIALSPLANLFLRGRLARYAAIDAALVADTAASCLLSTEPGVFRHENAAIRALAQR